MHASKNSMWRKILKYFAKFWKMGARPGSPAPGVPNDQIQCTVRRSRRCVDRVLTYHEMHVRRPCWPAWIIIIIFLVRNQASSSGWLRTIHVPQHCTVWLCHSSRGEWWRLWIVSALGSIGMSVSCEDSSAALAKCQTHEKRGPKAKALSNRVHLHHLYPAQVADDRCVSPKGPPSVLSPKRLRWRFDIDVLQNAGLFVLLFSMFSFFSRIFYAFC
jgi:hypothetical protein